MKNELSEALKILEEIENFPVNEDTKSAMLDVLNQTNLTVYNTVDEMLADILKEDE